MSAKFLGLLSFALISATAASTANESAPSTDFGQIFSPNRTLTTSAPVALIKQSWPSVPGTPNLRVRYYRLRVRVNNPSNAPWTLTFKSPAQQVLSAFERQKDCETAEGCWTRRLGAAAVQVEFTASDSTMSARVVAGLFMPDEATNPFYSPIATSPFEFLSELGSDEDERALKIRKSAERLGMLVTSATQGSTPLSWCCSGVRLTKELFLTNWHCGALEGSLDNAYWEGDGKSQACKNAIVDMSWDEDSVSRELSCRGVPYVSKLYDAAIIRLGTLPDGDQLTEPFNPLPISTAPPQRGKELFIVQHDACKPKRVTRACNVKEPDVPSWKPDAAPLKMSEFSYNCSTEGGSSGSPVFDAGSGALLGLHHLGYDVKNAAAVKENKGIKIQKILDDIKTKNPALHAEIMAQ